MKKLYIAVILFTAIALSLIPFMQPRYVWTGYGSMGSHFYKNQHYEIHYGEASTGVGKPQIYLLTSYDRIPLVEVSDLRSELNGLRVHDNFTERIRFEENSLVATYGEDVLVKKIVPKEDEIIISYYSKNSVNLTLTLWRWYYDSVENVTKYSPSGLKIKPSNKIHYTFIYDGGKFAGEIEFHEIPDEIILYNDGVGVNKIQTSFLRTQNITFKVKISEKPSHIILTPSSNIVYPLIAATISGTYLTVLKFSSKFKVKYTLNKSRPNIKPIYLALASFSIRAVLAPFFMHIWDITTMHDALNDFFSGKNVYATVVEKTIMLREANGVDASYEGYAYLPHAILIYMPFYLVYRLICGTKPAIVGGHFEAPNLIEPNIYIFLALLKLPIVLADTVITYVLAKRSSRLGLFYALLPYSIWITSVWGNFDSLIGLLLLLAFLIAHKKPIISGILYGTSFTKLFVAVTLPSFLLYLPRERSHLIKFILGMIVSQTPTIFFLLQDPNSILNVLLFHSIRSPGGVNIYNLAPKLYSYQLQSTLNRLSTVILALTLSAILLRVKSKKERILSSLAAYMAVGPVVNEQHLATLIPLLLILNYESLTLSLSTGYLTYALLYSGPTYFMLPLTKLLGGNAIVSNIESSWASLFNQITPQLLYTIALASSLAILYTIGKNILCQERT